LEDWIIQCRGGRGGALVNTSCSPNSNFNFLKQSPNDHQHGQVIEAQPHPQAGNAPISPHFVNNQSNVPSPPPAGSGVRRHVSLTYGAAVGGPRKVTTGLKRSGTLQAPAPNHSQHVSPDTSEHAEEEDYGYDVEDPAYEDEYYARQQQQQHPNNTMGRSSPWTSGNEWQQGYPTSGNGNAAIDDVQRALSTLQLQSNPGATSGMPQGAYGQYQQPPGTGHPPRFNATQHQSTGSRGSNGNDGGYNAANGGGSNKSMGPEFDGRKTPLSQPQRGGYIGAQQQYGQGQNDRGGSWDQKDQALRGRTSNPNLQYGYQQGHMKSGSSGSGAAGQSGPVPSVPPIPQQYLQQQGQGSSGGRPGLGVATTFPNNPASNVPSGQTPVQPFMNTPVDVPSLIAAKGYNPASFEIRPQFARFFVIKSYTEDDVHKSLKYEIWSSTDPGNKRLDKAFKDTAGRGPIYLFFSVNASGHFCGMAEMLTPVSSGRPTGLLRRPEY